METSSDNLPTTDDATQATGTVPETSGAPDNARDGATPEGAPTAAAAMAAAAVGAPSGVAPSRALSGAPDVSGTVPVA